MTGPLGADEVVYVTDSPLMADKSVYSTDSPLLADKSVYITDSPLMADKSVYITDSPLMADETVYVTNSPRQRGGITGAIESHPGAESDLYSGYGYEGTGGASLPHERKVERTIAIGTIAGGVVFLIVGLIMAAKVEWLCFFSYPLIFISCFIILQGIAKYFLSSRFHNFLQRLWKDGTGARFQKKLFLKRVMGIVILFTFSKWCKDGAIYTARWPEPVKYVGTAVFLLAVGLFVWGIVNTWKVICQLKLKGLLITFGIGYVLLVGASVLTSDTSLPFHQEAWLATRRLFISFSRKAHDVGQALVKAPGEFRFAHTGYRRPVLLPGMNPDDVSYLTPVPANRPAQLSSTPSPTSTPHETSVAGSPSPTSVFTPTPIQTEERSGTLPLYLPDCPHPQARLTAPQVNQVIKDEVQVEGTANIENFDYYKFELRREDGDIDDEWHWIESFKTPVEEGVLGIWRVSHLPAGIYTFRLTVVNQEGNYPFPPCDVTVQITHR